jgi:hypothetical protein
MRFKNYIRKIQEEGEGIANAGAVTTGDIEKFYPNMGTPARRQQKKKKKRRMFPNANCPYKDKE